jgi:hypothetical protein
MVRISHKVKHCTSGDAVKRLANAFDKCANVDFGRLAERFGRGTEEVIIAKLSISPKQSLHSNEEVADALHPKTHNFNQTRHYTLALWLFSRHAHSTFCGVFKGVCKWVCGGVEDD